MLSNAFLQKKSADALLMKDAAKMAAEIKIDVLPNATVTAIESKNKQVMVNGEVLSFGQLVLALGADPIRLPLQGNGAASVLSVNDLDDYRRFREAIAEKKRIAILGAGLIGCEFANDLTGAGYKVEVIDLAPQLLGRLLPPESAAFIHGKLEDAGIVFHLGASIQTIENLDGQSRLTLANGATVMSDVVLSAVGLKPRIALAASAGIKVNRGIVTNHQLQTNMANIYALGDCAEVEGQVLPFVMPMMQAARALAPTLAGKPTSVHYPAMPMVVKTPACPCVVCPPAAGAAGEWRVDANMEGIKAAFHHINGQLLGFALIGAAVSEKAALTQKLPSHLSIAKPMERPVPFSS